VVLSNIETDLCVQEPVAIGVKGEFPGRSVRVSVVESIPWFFCMRLVRLSDAFCFLIVRLANWADCDTA